MNWMRKTITCAAAISVFGTSVPALAADLHTYAPYVTPSYENETPFTKPIWSDSVDHDMSSMDGGGFIAADGGNIFYLKNGSIIAANAANGNRQWKFGSGLKSPLLYNNGTLYALNESGTLYAVNTGTGKVRWSATGVKDATQLIVDGKTLYVGLPLGLAAYDAATGKQLWTSGVEYANSGYEITAAGGVVMQMYTVSGAITRGMLAGFDSATGKLLWTKGYYSSPLAVDGDRLYANEYNFMADAPNIVKINTVDVKSGEVLKTNTYPFEQGQDIGKIVIDGDQLLIEVDGEVYRYNRDADPSRTQPVVQHLGALNQTNSWIAGPYEGRYFYVDDSMYLGSYYPAKQNYTSFLVDNPISRLELNGNGVYVGQTDGQFKIFDLQSGKMLLRADVSVRRFEDIVVEGDTVLVQAEKQLLAFKIPAAAKKETASYTSANPYVVEADAKLLIDGKQAQFQPAPVFVNNRLFVPFRSLFSAVGATVDYEADTRTVKAAYGDIRLSFRPNESIVDANGTEVGLSEASFLHNNTVYIPLRDVSNLLGAKVDWNSGSRTVTVDTAK